MELNEGVYFILQGTTGNGIPSGPVHLYSVSIVLPTASTRGGTRRGISFGSSNGCLPLDLLGSGSGGNAREVVEGDGAQGIVYDRFLRINVDGGLFRTILVLY